ncbi:uncharacterized protein APUU_20268A [Aspergillus puulaauensis]|uniref:Uncharacterized protein n=1 Tax=Aspergillus puulaauensis TaxID=1220207 RepID=A0A7R7XEQ5_9EURO|nr:uncharacterized protein APUU_20268A [Aspergillus puulaauensis]BCS19836.1 hypothetical protein APUU_20268A [Aspergillus puulaauensis]
MPLPDSNTPLNPTVEEMPDEEGANNARTAPNPGTLWPQICTQHDSVLSSHLSTLQALKEQVSSDPEASQLISAMIERTNKLMLQFEGVKKHITPRMGRRSDPVRPTGDGTDSTHTTPSRPEDGSGRKRRKRNRLSNTEIESEVEAKEPLLEVQRLKRKRTDVAIPGADDDVQSAIPVSLETEDISDEVQRRLEIKEEQRRKRDSKPEKRKRERDSLASNSSTLSTGGTKPRKKFKLSGGANR